MRHVDEGGCDVGQGVGHAHILAASSERRVTKRPPASSDVQEVDMSTTQEHTADATEDRTLTADVVVVGAGLAGLVAAATAARDGAHVVLLDARSAGGRARSATRDGFVLNEGGHALYRDAGGLAVLRDLGVEVAGDAPPLRSYRTVWDGAIAPLPVTPSAILSSRLLGARSKAKLVGWYADIGRTAARAGDVALDEWLDDQGARPDLRRFVAALGRLVTYSARPERLPAAAVLGQLGAGGVLYVHGGWQSLVDQLLTVARAHGVVVHEHAPVVSLERDGTRWISTTARGRTVTATTVVLAAGGPHLAASLLGADDAGWIERAGPVQRASCLDVGGARGTCDFLLSADEPLYLSLHAPVARLAPPGEALYSLMRYLDAGDDGSSGEHRRSLEAHAARAGLPSEAERTLHRFLAAPVVAWGSPQVGVERPTGLELADRGVLAAGDWIGRPLLADAAIVSGSVAGVTAARRAMVAA
jgi:2-polyprenyl-6-methoxyphenol hydroxylase-like FAD-dependent oxidoreductase